MSHAELGTGRPCEQLPSAQDCYHCANLCLDMWNDSVDHAARSWLLQMADAWLHLTSEPNGEGGAYRLMSSRVFSCGEGPDRHQRYRLAVQRARHEAFS
jgi:hypothetical protein